MSCCDFVWLWAFIFGKQVKLHYLMCTTPSCISAVYESQLILHVSLRRRWSCLITPCWDIKVSLCCLITHIYMLWVHKSKVHGFISLYWSLFGVVSGLCSNCLHYQWSSHHSFHYRKNALFSGDCPSLYLWMPSWFSMEYYERKSQENQLLETVAIVTSYLAVNRFPYNPKMFVWPKSLFSLFCVCAFLYADVCVKNTSIPLIWIIMGSFGLWCSNKSLRLTTALLCNMSWANVVMVQLVLGSNSTWLLGKTSSHKSCCEGGKLIVCLVQSSNMYWDQQ